MSMKTQETFSVVVTENVKAKDDNGQIESVKKTVIFTESALPAYSVESAKIKAVIAASKVKGIKAIVDVDEVEVACRPFCG